MRKSREEYQSRTERLRSELVTIFEVSDFSYKKCVLLQEVGVVPDQRKALSEVKQQLY